MKYHKPKSILEQLPTKSEVIEQLFKFWKPENTTTETILLNQAKNRFLAKDIYAKHSLPVFRCANMDGIAFCYNHFEQSDTTKWQKDIDYCMADTGDDFQEPFDTVVRIEAIEFLNDSGLKIDQNITGDIEKGQCVSLSGSRLQNQEMLVKAGTKLNPLQINLLSMGGYFTVPVIKKPRVAYIPTGNELVPTGVVPKQNKNIESNGLMVEQLVEQWGAEIVRYPICEDIQADLECMLKEAMNEADIVLINGGSSKGSEDFNSYLIEAQASFFQHHVRCAPGYPVGIGLIKNIPVINVPGPPTATFAVMNWCVQMLIYKAMNVEDILRHKTYARITIELKGSECMEFYDCAFIENRNGEQWITPFDKKIRTAETLGTCNSFIILQPNTIYKIGDWIEAEWIE